MEPKILFDDHKLRNEIEAWVATGTFKATDLYTRIATFTNAEIFKNVCDALGKVEMAAHPEIGRPMTEGEDRAIGWGWTLACDWLRQRIDQVIEMYRI